MARTFLKTSNQWLALSSALTQNAPVSMACWYKRTSVIGSSAVEAIMVISSPAGSFFSLSLYGSDNLVRAECSGAVDDDTAASSVVVGNVTGTFFHICASFTSGVARACYVNGGSPGISSVNVSPSSLTGTGIGGCNVTGGPFSTDAAIAAPAIWVGAGAALSASDALSLSQGTNPRRVRPSYLASLLFLSTGASPEPDAMAARTFAFQGTGVPSLSPNPRLFM